MHERQEHCQKPEKGRIMKEGRALTVKSLYVWSLMLVAGTALGHCQIPCGIYGDATRITILHEHVTTIEKSMKLIGNLSGEKQPDNNQIVRWVVNKEEHADKIAHIATQYFLAQRTKPVSKDDKKAYTEYSDKLAVLHEIIVASMKSKQSLDSANAAKLHALVDKLAALYGIKQHKH
jgi:nickel superoxide dismutase